MGRLTSSSILALDSNIFIAAYNEANEFYDLSASLLSKIAKISPKVFISVLVFEEFLVKIYQNNLEKGLVGYENFLTSGGLIKVINIDRKVARKAAQIRAKYPKIKTPDAIHIACAIESGVKMFITTDRNLPGKIDKLRILNLKELK